MHFRTLQAHLRLIELIELMVQLKISGSLEDLAISKFGRSCTDSRIWFLKRFEEICFDANRLVYIGSQLPLIQKNSETFRL